MSPELKSLLSHVAEGLNALRHAIQTGTFNSEHDAVLERSVSALRDAEEADVAEVHDEIAAVKTRLDAIEAAGGTDSGAIAELRGRIVALEAAATAPVPADPDAAAIDASLEQGDLGPPAAGNAGSTDPGSTATSSTSAPADASQSDTSASPAAPSPGDPIAVVITATDDTHPSIDAGTAVVVTQDQTDGGTVVLTPVAPDSPVPTADQINVSSDGEPTPAPDSGVVLGPSLEAPADHPDIATLVADPAVDTTVVATAPAAPDTGAQET